MHPTDQPTAPSSTPAPAPVARARDLLRLLADTSEHASERLLASAALGHLDDVHRPRPPAAPASTPLREAALREAALVDEAVSALITAIGDSDDPAERAGLLLALEELTAPLDPASTDVGAHSGPADTEPITRPAPAGP